MLRPEEDGALGIKPHPKKNLGSSPNIKTLIDLKEKENKEGEIESCACWLFNIVVAYINE